MVESGGRGEKMSEALYNELAPYYDLIMDRDTEKEIKFLNKVFSENDVESVLDIACGTGRHACPLKKKDYDVTGIDLSEKMLEQARKKCNARFIQGDITSMSLEENYDTAIFLWSTVNLFSGKEEVKEILGEIKESLSKDGIFILDAKKKHPEEEKHDEKTLESDEVKINVKSTREYKWNSKESTYRYRVLFKEDNKEKEFVDHVQMNLYSLEELEEIIQDVGFQIQKVLGAYDLDKEFKGDEDRMIFILRNS